MINRYLYPLELFTDSGGRVVAIFPDLEGAAPDGADRAEALAEATDCLEEAIAGCMARREDIPPASAAGAGPC
jgi:predicted RNase H-like HicB family nuclease